MTVNEKPLNSVEDLLFIFANQNVLLTQPRLLRRFDRAADRYYYVVEGNGIDQPYSVRYFVSTTSFCSRVLPTAPHLIEWFKKMGEAADDYRDQRAVYGTMMHIAFADFLTKGYDFGGTRSRVEQQIIQHGYSPKLIPEWSLDLNKAVTSYARFCDEYKVEPVLIEGMLASEELQIGGTLDLVCYMTPPKKERVLAQVDSKSGGIYLSAELQLVINKLLFEANFTHLEIDKLYSWAPKDFRSEPTFTLKDQTATKFTPAILDALMTTYGALYGWDLTGKEYHEFEGVIQPGTATGEHHSLLTISDVVLKSHNQ